ncbi:unnamed protein product [Cyprideis torosa]|uniref:Uncharacterized protein n=1 Tax=Cyprideis torosa TaxID=163714 RepID=A0A7R8WCI5_9CRUS|nr:unnamed protein product [Cyprideis torosa]CAG0893418.1 unnamed protein product [Cyprideis torosa]
MQTKHEEFIDPEFGFSKASIKDLTGDLSEEQRKLRISQRIELARIEEEIFLIRRCIATKQKQLEQVQKYIDRAWGKRRGSFLQIFQRSKPVTAEEFASWWTDFCQRISDGKETPLYDRRPTLWNEPLKVTKDRSELHVNRRSKLDNRERSTIAAGGFHQRRGGGEGRAVFRSGGGNNGDDPQKAKKQVSRRQTGTGAARATPSGSVQQQPSPTKTASRFASAIRRSFSFVDLRPIDEVDVGTTDDFPEPELGDSTVTPKFPPERPPKGGIPFTSYRIVSTGQIKNKTVISNNRRRVQPSTPEEGRETGRLILPKGWSKSLKRVSGTAPPGTAPSSSTSLTVSSKQKRTSSSTAKRGGAGCFHIVAGDQLMLLVTEETNETEKKALVPVEEGEPGDEEETDTDQ